MPRRALAVLALLPAAAFTAPRPAAAADYDAQFAGYQTTNGLFPDEVLAEWVAPGVLTNGTGLSTWVGLDGAAGVLQVGTTTGPVYGTNCWWEDYPYNDQQPIAGLRCAPGDLIFADVAQDFYGPKQSRVIVVDETTGQSSGWMRVYTPDLNYSPVAQATVEWNTSLGPVPWSFSAVSFSSPTAVAGGYLGSGGKTMSFSGLAYFGLLDMSNSLTSIIWGVSLSQNWAADIETVDP
jgi:hypothetical protein